MDADLTSRYASIVNLLLPVVLLSAAFAAVYWPTAKWLWMRWQMGVWYNEHGVLIPVISAYMIWHKLSGEKCRRVEEGNAYGFLLLVPALVLHVIDNLVWSQILSALSIVPALVGLSFLLLGRSLTFAILVPLLLLFFMIPIPLAASQPVVLVLRTLTTIGAEKTLMLMGYSAYSSGTSLELINGPVNVGDPCSGFSTLYATVAFTIFLAYMWPQGLLRSSLFVLLAFPMALCANVFRVVMLCLLKIYYGDQIFDTFLHPLSGYVAYFLAVGLQGGLMWVFRKRSP
jgi:exosortase